MYYIDYKTNAIYLVRGDTLLLTLDIYTNTGVKRYIPKEEDTIIFSLKKMIENKVSSESSEPLLVKNISPESMKLELLPEDTKNLLFGKYWYDISIVYPDGTVDTIIPTSEFILLEKV